MQVSAKTEAGFFNIGHMTNTPRAIDWAVDNGANGVEVDLQFHSNGDPEIFKHGGPLCDCICCFSYTEDSTEDSGEKCVCHYLGEDPCNASTPVTKLLNHIASKSQLALVVIDSKVSTSDNLEQAGIKVIDLLNRELFDKGYIGNVIIDIAKAVTLDYLRAASKHAASSKYKSRYYFSIDEGGDDVVGTIEALISLQGNTTNRVYGTGITACLPTTFYDAILLGRANQQKGVVGTVYIWTLDKVSSMEKYIRKGALGIITNHPPRLDALIRKKGIRLAAPGSSIPTATSNDIVKSLKTCDCDYHSGGCAISKAAPPGFACECIYKNFWTCSGQDVICLDPNSFYCKNPDTSIQSCVQGGGDCEGYKETCDCDYHSGGCKISQAAVHDTACRCDYKFIWRCDGEIDKCKDFASPYCKNPDKSYSSCLQGMGDCGGY